MLFFASWDRRLYALNAVNGVKLWSFKTASTVTLMPLVAGSASLTLVAALSVLAAFTPSLSLCLRNHRVYQVSTDPVVHPDGKTVFVIADLPMLYALRAKDGAVQWVYTPPGYVSSAPSSAVTRHHPSA